jgi:hypothetical protein
MHQEMFQHGTVAFAPLGQRHFQCAFERGGHALVWIDDKKGAFHVQEKRGPVALGRVDPPLSTCELSRMYFIRA